MSKIYVGEGAIIRGKEYIQFGENVNIWYNAVIRATHNDIIIGDNTNIQDNCTLHADVSKIILGNNVTIGHGAIVHGCSVGDNSLIGMGAIVLNHAKIGKNCIVGAGAVVTQGAEIPDNTLVVGCPAKAIRATTEEDENKAIHNAHHYVELAQEELKRIMTGFIFRDITTEEIEQAISIEQICFPPNEACSPENITKRVGAAPEVFMVAIDEKTGKIAGFLNGLSTMEDKFRDEFFTDISLYDPSGKNVMLLGLDVLPEYRRRGLATEIVKQYADREKANGREKLYLTCLDSKVSMYEKFGFEDLGMANSTWGGEEWHEMVLKL